MKTYNRICSKCDKAFLSQHPGKQLCEICYAEYKPTGPFRAEKVKIKSYYVICRCGQKFLANTNSKTHCPDCYKETKKVWRKEQP